MSEEYSNDLDTIMIKLKADFLKLEYEKCVEAYFDIYNSIWRIFSYMSAITAAFLIFSKEFPTFRWPLIILIASSPLVFWYIGIYLPMNKYGGKRLEILKEITDNINSINPIFPILNAKIT